MKFLLKVFALLLVAGMAHAQVHQATGVVKRIDVAKGAVLMKHDPVKSLNWPSMTMGFAVRDAKLLAGLKPEQAVKFEFVVENGRSVITAFK